MEFAFTQEQELAQPTVGRFAREKWLPNYSRWGRGEKIKVADIRQATAAMGLANRCVPDADLDSTAPAFALKIATNSPNSIAAYKVLYCQGMGKTVWEAVLSETTSTCRISDTEQPLAKFC